MSLVIENLTVAYGTRTVLHNLSLEVPEGALLGIIGPNGAGKSTLLRAISGVLPLVSGRVVLDGTDLAGLAPGERARCLAVVPQARRLPPAFSGWEVVALGRTPHLNWLGQTSRSDEAIVRQAMQRTQTQDLAARRVGELSGGEQQRLLLARALAQATPVLLLDEPTTHLDLQHQLGLLEQVRVLVHSPNQLPQLTLAVLHDLNLVARYADRVALLVEGHLVAYGTPAHVLTPERLSAAYRVPLDVMARTPGGYPIILPRMASE